MEVDIARKRIALSIKQTKDAPTKEVRRTNTHPTNNIKPTPKKEQDLADLSVNDALALLKKKFGK